MPEMVRNSHHKKRKNVEQVLQRSRGPFQSQRHELETANGWRNEFSEKLKEIPWCLSICNVSVEGALQRFFFFFNIYNVVLQHSEGNLLTDCSTFKISIKNMLMHKLGAPLIHALLLRSRLSLCCLWWFCVLVVLLVELELMSVVCEVQYGGVGVNKGCNDCGGFVGLV